MNRQDFMNQLAAELSKLPKEEVQAAMEYYSEYFDEAGPEREQQAIKDLGSPSKIVTQIKADYAVRQLDEPGNSRSAKKGLTALLWVVLGVFAAPVALPVAIALGICAFAVFFCALVVLVALIVSLGACCLGGIAFVAAGIAGLGASLSGSLFLIGIGLVASGIMALLCVGAAVGTKALVRAAARQMRKSRNYKLRAGYTKKEKEAGSDA